MAKEKVTITLDRSKAEEARALVGATSTSELIDKALDRLIKVERLRRDIEAYRRMPLTEGELTWGFFPSPDLGDDTDWEALFPEDPHG